MTINVTYTFELVQTLDLIAGPAIGNVDVTALANGGFAAVGDYNNSVSTYATLDIFNASAILTGGQSQPTGYAGAATAQLVNGNIAVVSTGAQDTGYLSILAGNGTFVETLDFFTTTGEAATGVDVAALTSGNFVAVTGSSGKDIAARIHNEAGTELLYILVDGISNASNPVVAALDDGGFAVAWEALSIGGSRVHTAVYNANGSVRRAAQIADSSTGSGMGEVAITATNGGFAIVYEDDSVSANTDIAILLFDANGALLSGGGTLTGPATIDETPRIARMPDGLLAVTFGFATVGPADSNTDVVLFNPASGTILAERIVTAGEPLSDDTDFAALAAHGVGQLAVFHTNRTDNDADGEDLRVVRTSTGDATGEIFSGSGYRDIQNGGGGSDFLDGDIGDDTLNGDAGNDNLLGGPGNDILNGGANIDTALYTGAAGVTVNLALTTAQNTGGAGTDTLAGIENLTGGNGNDTLTGNSLANRLDGGAGNDALNGADGNDTLIASQGNDAYTGGAGIDTVDFSNATGPITVNLTLATAQNTGQGSDTFAGIENLIGSAFADTFTGQNFLNRFDGGAGADELRGGSGNDTLNGDFGADLIVGDAGNDIINGGTEIDRLYGGTGNDAIFGAEGADTLIGGPGIDRLDGGAGADRLYADGTADTFVFANADGIGDRIFSFVSGIHNLEIDASVFGGAAGAFSFRANANPTPSSGAQWLLYDTDDGKLYLDPDGNGAGGRVYLLTLVGAPVLAGVDIVLA